VEYFSKDGDKNLLPPSVKDLLLQKKEWLRTNKLAWLAYRKHIWQEWHPTRNRMRRMEIWLQPADHR